MADPSALEQDAKNFAIKAVENDQKGNYVTAVFYYMEAAQALLNAAEAGSKIENITKKAEEYISRAETLKQTKGGNNSNKTFEMKSDQQQNLERGQFLLHQAFDEDENNNSEEAIELYTSAVELFLGIKNKTYDTALQEKVKKLAMQALDRAEVLKSKSRSRKPAPAPVPYRPLGQSLGPESQISRRGKSPNRGAGSGGYTKEEIHVLRITSMINAREYVPFMSVDMKERFAYPVPFSDKHGKLVLSPKQKSKFSGWVRPDEFMENPQMIYAVSSFSIRQTVVSDCSFVASLAISAAYERRFKQKLITSIIYPQNRQGEPQYNPCGKYMVKLNINGVHRKVIIDDYLPMGQQRELLCSFSNNSSELWVSLLEKAYMKVMGGYDFPGSNSNIDLHALTGWIPERVAIRPGSDEFDADKEFQRVLDRFHKGHCLVTVATGEMSDAEGDRAGLVPTHAYAMLDVREVKGIKLMQLKNPWNHLRWKGNYSERDDFHWTPDMQKALNYDPKSAQTYDNGVFWIDFDSVIKFFDVIYINWNPSLFAHTTCIHHTWTAKEGPKKDVYNIGDNPQYKLEVKATNPKAAIWILLTRHITDKDDFANNREFITVLVYKSEGKRVFYPYDPPPYKDGVRINSPHYLCKMLEDVQGTSTYTLVISQYEKNNSINYTLRVYSTCEFTLSKINEPYNPAYEKQITGQWKGRSAGGCGNYPATHDNNPAFQIKMDNHSTDNHVMIELRGPKQYSVGFELTCVVPNVPNAPGNITKKTSGDYRKGFCVLQLENISGGVYNIMPSTFYPGEEGPFLLNISSSSPLTVAAIH